MKSKGLHLRIRIAALLILIISFCILAALVLNGGIAGFESGLYVILVQYMNPTLTRIMIAVTNMGSTVAVVTITVILLALPFTRKKFGLPIAVNAAGSATLNFVLKNVIARPRPDKLWLITETGYGFPSGHAMNNAALYTMILLIAFRQTENIKIRISILLFALVMPFCIGISRIYLGVHNAGDVLAGWVMGVFFALLVDTLWQFYNKKIMKRKCK